MNFIQKAFWRDAKFGRIGRIDRTAKGHTVRYADKKQALASLRDAGLKGETLFSTELAILTDYCKSDFIGRH